MGNFSKAAPLGTDRLEGRTWTFRGILSVWTRYTIVADMARNGPNGRICGNGLAGTRPPGFSTPVERQGEPGGT